MKKILLLFGLIFFGLQFCYSQAGKLDPSFGNNGIVQSDFGKKYNYEGTVKKILLHTDGSIYAILDVSGKTLITKTLSNGSLDLTYGVNGFSSVAGITTNDAAFQSDGKIVIAGSSDNSFGVVRYNKDGSIDNSFSAGKLLFQYKHDDNRLSAFNAVAVQNDGKILLGGLYGIDEDNSNIFLIRINTDGSMDNSFNSNSTYINVPPPPAKSIVLQSDEKIVVAASYNDDNYITVIRYNLDGSLDSSFSGDGIQTTSFVDKNGNSLSGSATSLAIQTGGKIVVAGRTHGGQSFDGFIGIIRYNTDGSADNSFSKDGQQQTSITGYIGLVATDVNNKIIVAGSGSLARYNKNGSLDSTFNKNGVRVTDFSIASIVVQSNAKIVAAGDENYKSEITRYNTNGSLDIAYGKGGKFINDIKAGNTAYTSIAIQKDGKAVTTGRTWNGSDFDFIVTRYNSDGSLDNTFNSNGKRIIAFTLTSVAIQNDGKIVVGGARFLGRYNTDGTEDVAFNKKTAQVTYFNIASVVIQKDGKILVAGSDMMRFNTDGSLDNTFNGNGTVKLPFATRRAALQSDGKIVVAGTYNDNFAVARLNTNGSLDNSFSNDGIQTIEFTDYDDNHVHSEASLAAVGGDGKIVVSGSGIVRGRFYAEYTTYFIQLFYTDGSLGAHYRSAIPTDIVVQDDGQIVVSEAHTIFRFLDESNYTEEIQTTSYDIASIAIASNKLYAAGTTGTVGIVARYLLDGTNTPPTVTLTTPADNATYLAPAAHIKLSAAAADKDGTITKVEFYNGTTLLHTETVFPYGYVWRNVGPGNYTITAKAYDNSGNVATSAPLHISVVPNKVPVVSIISPANNQTYADTATIHLEAAATDTDGRITNVKFYNGTTLLRTEFTYPYTYNWENVPAGTYTITAVAADNWGAHTTSAPVTITITSAKAMIVSSKPINNKTGIKEEISVKLSPNPASNIVNLYTSGLKPNKPADISIISISGIVLKKVQTSNAVQMQVDVSSLVKGVYTIKIASGDKVIFKQFVKL